MPFEDDLAIIYADTPHEGEVTAIAADLRVVLDERPTDVADAADTAGAADTADAADADNAADTAGSTATAAATTASPGDSTTGTAASAGAPATDTPWSEDDVWVIAYPDHFRAAGRAPLAVLPDALDALAPEANGVHVLPCYPWSSDDGYAVIDPLVIDDDYGDWDDVTALAAGRRVMLDAVVNHLSASSPWFQRFLAGEDGFRDAFVTADPDDDLDDVVRPRSLPLLTPFDRHDGRVWVWTTFSADQVDVNIDDPTTLLRLVDVLVRYAEAGADAIRLDAVGFLAKRIGTTCIHLPQTHAAVRLMRAALDRHHPDVVLITETNVPHRENISYLGAPGEREAQAVYQFSLPPLVLHTMHTGDATALADWAETFLADPAGPDDVRRPGATTFFNFLASHDGIGLRPVEGLLTDGELDAMVARVTDVGGVVNMRATPEGDRPYELCTTWFDAVALGDEDRGVAHHLASHAIMLLLPGIAAVYAHSLVGSSNDRALYEQTGAGRSLNRARFDLDDLVPLQPGSRAARVNEGLADLMKLRRAHACFDPDAAFALAEQVPGLFRFVRGDGDERMLVEINVDLVERDGIAVGGWRITPTGAAA